MRKKGGDRRIKELKEAAGKENRRYQHADTKENEKIRSLFLVLL